MAFFSVANVQESKLVAWSDSCSGQNKNFGIICLWQYLLLNNYFQTIEHKYPEPGHSYLDSERDFGKVETCVKRRESIYSVDEYQAIMSASQAKVTVTRIGDKMLDVSNMCKEIGLVKPKFDVNGQKIEFRDKVRWVRITEFGKYSYKYSFSCDEPWKEVHMRQHSTLLPSPQLQLLNGQPSTIKRAKLKDIQKQLKYIPAIYQGLYLGILGNIEPNNIEEPQPLVIHDPTQQVMSVNSSETSEVPDAIFLLVMMSVD